MTSPSHSARHALEKYLQGYGEPDITQLILPAFEPVQAICIVPIYDEPLAPLLQMLKLDSDRKRAFVFVFNAPDNASESSLQTTRNCLKALVEFWSLEQSSERLWVGDAGSGAVLWVLDYTGAEQLLNPKQGVGLARKLGLDFALRLCLAQSHDDASMPTWLHSCDADVTLPPGYFDIPAPLPTQHACVYPISHQPEPELSEAMALYDLRLDYYVDQLKRAGSPYAFHTVGSAIALTPKAYAQVRGVPKRAAGEDFYLLNKVAKLAIVPGEAIVTLSQPELQVEGRPSQRVPFGTGPALRDIVALDSPHEHYTYYDPEIFTRLKALLSVARTFEAGDYQAFVSTLRLDMDDQTCERVVEVLDKLGIATFFEHWSTQAHRQHFWHLFCTWFDAFKTLKFVHVMRDRDCPSLNIERLRERSGLLSPALGARIEAMLNQHS